MTTGQVTPSAIAENERLHTQKRLVARLHLRNHIATSMLAGISALVLLIFLAIIGQILMQGAPSFLRADFYGTGDAGIGNEIYNSFYILILTEISLCPIALAAAIYMIEYARKGIFVSLIHFAAETLAGVPSIVLGLFGFLVFGIFFHLGTSRICGALTLLCLNLPIALRLFEDALTAVPREIREGGLALGATKWRIIRTVVLPSALPGLVTGIIISAGKIIGEAAALIYTMGLFNPASVMNLNPGLASDTLTTRLYYLKGPGGGTTTLTASQETATAAGIAAVLILFLLLINIISRSLSHFIQRKITAV